MHKLTKAQSRRLREIAKKAQLGRAAYSELRFSVALKRRRNNAFLRVMQAGNDDDFDGLLGQYGLHPQQLFRRAL